MAADAGSPPAVEHVVLLIHGIRSEGAWMQTIEQAIQDQRIRVVPIKYGWFPALRFLLPWDTSRGPVAKVHDEYLTVKDAFPEAKVSAIAHSLGTHVLTRTLMQKPTMRLWRIILCGSVVKQDFQWVRVKDQIGDGPDKARNVVNDCGNKDVWPVIGSSAGWWYGNAGTDGFSGALVTNRFHVGGHGLFFDQDFIGQYWTPFVREGTIVHGTASQGEGIPWYIRLIGHHPVMFKLFLLALVVLFITLAGVLVAYFFLRPILDSITIDEFDRQVTVARQRGTESLATFAREHERHSIHWVCRIAEKQPEDSAYIITTPDGQGVEHIYAAFRDASKYQASLAEDSERTISGRIQAINNLGTILKDCEFVEPP